MKRTGSTSAEARAEKASDDATATGSAIVTLSLLISAATAGAECARVLVIERMWATRGADGRRVKHTALKFSSVWLTEPDVLEALAKRRRGITGWRRW